MITSRQAMTILKLHAELGLRNSSGLVSTITREVAERLLKVFALSNRQASTILGLHEELGLGASTDVFAAKSKVAEYLLKALDARDEAIREGRPLGLAPDSD